MKKYILITFSLMCVFNAMAQTGLKTGTQAPDFTIADNSGKTVDLKTLLKQHKAVVLFFYRGQWCPYCNKYVQQLQDSLQLLTTKGAYIIGVTPETNENISKTIAKTHASFSIVQDKNAKIMKAYDVSYTVGDALYSKLKNYGVDLDRNNGDKNRTLPVPATYVIDKTGKIVFVQFDKDYTRRASVSAIAAAL